MVARISKNEANWTLVVAILVVAASCLPYLLAWGLAPDGTHYSGLLINHYDGHSYYAKMQQGARGDWLFHLAFTPEPHEGALVFAFYLALGHLAAALQLPIPWVYHLARAAAGLFMLLVAYRFIARFFSQPSTRRIAFLLLALSAGFGWLLAPLGIPTADVWVAEGFTFLSILANPHFPLSIGLMLLLFTTILDLEGGPFAPASLAGTALLGLCLAVVQPFAVPIVLAVLGVYLVLTAWQERRIPWRRGWATAVAAVAAAPVMVYDLVVYTTNPAFAAWAAQNVTPSLPPCEYALGYGLVLLLAIPGTIVALRRRTPADLFLIAWAGTVILLLYVPFALQRRFITGLHVPLVLLATLGLEQGIYPRLPFRQRGTITTLILALSALTNVFVPLVTVAGVAQGQAPLVMTEDQAAALNWLADETQWTDTVLAPVSLGHAVPAWAGNRVVYGHPFETIDAVKKKPQVEAFYRVGTAPAERQAILEEYGVHYVLLDDPDGKLRADLDRAHLGLAEAWREGDVALYRVEGTR